MPSVARQLRRVVDGHLRGEAERQHHATHALRAERIHGDRRTERRVDAAGDAEQHARKAVLAHIVAQAQHAGGVIALLAVDDLGHRPLAAPAVRRARPLQRGQALLERRKLRRQRTVAVQRERSAVEHQFILAAELVEVDQRQAALGDARHRDVDAHVVLVARVRRAVRHDEDFRAGLAQALDHVLVGGGLVDPDVLADRHADAHALERHGAGRLSGHEHPLLVEHAVVRQVDLVADRSDPPAIEQGAGVVELAVLDPWGADQHRGSAVGRLARQRFDGRAAGRLERGFQHQVFRRIAADEQLGKDDQVGAVGGRAGARLARLRSVAFDVAHGRVELGERDGEAVGGFAGHGSCKSSVATRFRNCRLCRSDDPQPLGDGKDPEKSGDQRVMPTAAEPMSFTRPICSS